MRIVSHPNIVELKSFYYSNGERVSQSGGWCDLYNISLTKSNIRKMRYTSIWSSNLCPKRSIEPLGSSTR